ncbi:MAG: hypothetical protein C0485_06945 [Pirellula sp.]|nr:hypothetical protein [Pirellula sp.]
MKPRFVAALLFVSLQFTPTIAGPPVRTVALTHTEAPGVGAGTLFSDLFLPVLNNKGQTVFASMLLDGGNALNTTWTEGSGSLAMLVQKGSAAPATEPGVTFGEMSTPVLSDSGASAFWSSLNGVSDPNNSEGYWSYANGSVSLLARSGSQAPDTPAGVVFSAPLGFHSLPAISDNGTVALSSFIYGPGVDSINNRGIWTKSTGNLTLAYRSGTQAPGLDSGVLITGPTVLYTGPVVNDAGEIVFLGTLTGPGIGPTNNQSLWSTGGGSLHMVARTGSQAPGAPEGVTFTDFWEGAWSMLLNNSGETAFQGVTSDGGYGIWSERGGLHAVARSGQSTPGLPGETFRDFSVPVLNANGHVAFAGFVASGKNGLWSEGNGELALVAMAGNPAPGAPSGVTFHSFSAPTLNGRGQFAFQAYLNDLKFPNASGVWVQDVDGVLRAIVRSGDSIEVAPGDVRIVNSVGFLGGSGNEDGRHSAFNDLGQLAFQASFTDGTQGIFVTDIVAVPEPAAWVLALLAIGAVRFRRGV